MAAEGRAIRFLLLGVAGLLAALTWPVVAADAVSIPLIAALAILAGIGSAWSP